MPSASAASSNARLVMLLEPGTCTSASSRPAAGVIVWIVIVHNFLQNRSAYLTTKAWFWRTLRCAAGSRGPCNGNDDIRTAVTAWHRHRQGYSCESPLY